MARTRHTKYPRKGGTSSCPRMKLQTSAEAKKKKSIAATKRDSNSRSECIVLSSSDSESEIKSSHDSDDGSTNNNNNRIITASTNSNVRKQVSMERRKKQLSMRKASREKTPVDRGDHEESNKKKRKRTKSGANNNNNRVDSDAESVGNDDEYFDIERVYDSKVEDNKPLFHAHWTGYPDDSDTWEPVDHLHWTDAFKEYVRDEINRRAMNDDPAIQPLLIELRKPGELHRKHRKALKRIFNSDEECLSRRREAAMKHKRDSSPKRTKSRKKLKKRKKKRKRDKSNLEIKGPALKKRRVE